MIGWCKGGASRRHTRPTDSLDTYRGRRYKQILAPPRTQADKGPLAGLPGLQLFRGSGQGDRFPGPWKARRCKWVPALIDSVYGVSKVISEARAGDGLTLEACPVSCHARPLPPTQIRRVVLLLLALDQTPSRCLCKPCHAYKDQQPICRQHTAASLSHIVCGAQPAGWAAKSIQPSMIHQIGVGICPERLDPAVVGVLNPRTSFEG